MTPCGGFLGALVAGVEVADGKRAVRLFTVEKTSKPSRLQLA